MSPYIAFHDDQVVLEADEWVDSDHLPAGTYIRFMADTELWYQVIKRSDHSHASGINRRDIPDWIKTYLLIL